MFMLINIHLKYLKSTFSYIFKSYSKEYPATLKTHNLPKYVIAKNNKKKLRFNQLWLIMEKLNPIVLLLIKN